MIKKIKTLTEKLEDERSKKLVFVAHCLLNENARFLSIGFRKGCVDEIVDELQSKGVGIIQMPCPEQKAWGGVLKIYPLLTFGSKLFYRLRKIVIPLFLWNTKRIYRKIARETVKWMRDYINCGYEVVGIIGNSGSPTCGVSLTMDLQKSLELLKDVNVRDIGREEVNKLLIENCLFEGTGFYIEALKDELQKRSINIKFYENDFLSEYRGDKIEFELV